MKLLLGATSSKPIKREMAKNQRASSRPRKQANESALDENEPAFKYDSPAATKAMHYVFLNSFRYWE
ncbi:hypothetical protein L596_003797 [Steinernema carpocapsae]|uniref:Uncharacterized protein n=1 Tax=Steinernema carpocapsae TaxID=34508 RepID=A0A4U8UVC0_STECR|nr:hypothetical protein L596_003797 [Steinernema carpocapsae]